jgi:hypothetical protein
MTQPVTRVYLEPGVVLVPEGVGGGSGGDHLAAAPEAIEALGYLADGGHELVILGEGDLPILDQLPIAVRTTAQLPDEPGPDAWLITSDPEECGVRRRGLRTILVGPKRASTHRPAARCDLEARDLNAAVIEILAREAMS